MVEIPSNGPSGLVWMIGPANARPKDQIGGQTKNMFDKKSLDAMFNELRDNYELEPEWHGPTAAWTWETSTPGLLRS